MVVVENKPFGHITLIRELLRRGSILVRIISLIINSVNVAIRGLGFLSI
jgi:hypothetical protein